MPHLSDLQDKYPQAIFLGVAVMESGIDAVRAFVSEMDKQIRYRIAVEAPLPGRSGRESGWMTKHWLEASYQRGIPSAFIVNPAGQIAWIGHPIDLEEPLAAVIDGRWDLSSEAQAHREKLANRNIRERFRLAQELKSAVAANDIARAVGLIDDAINVHPELEGEFGCSKLSILVKDTETKSLALAYAVRLIDVVGHTDVELLLSVSVRLLETNPTSGPGKTVIPDADFARLAVQAMRQVEVLLVTESPTDPIPPAVWMHIEMYFARGLIAIGELDEALVHAQRAHNWGKEAGAPDDELAKIDALMKQCQESP